MNLVRGKFSLIGIPILVAAIALPGFSQATGAVTGKAMDGSGGLIPGVEVSVTSPSMIGGARSAPTDETGSYRFTLLPPGQYRVTFALPGFKTLNVEGVQVDAGATMTINGKMEVASVSEEVTVTSQAPTIDLEAATVGVNWGKGNLDNLPWGRSVVALAGMVPGMFVTTYDVGGNQMGGSSTLGGRVYGRSGGEVRTYDGIAWCMGFDDFGTYEEIQLSAAAKGADSMNTGVTANYVIKSGGNEFHGSSFAAWEDKGFQSNNVDSDLIKRGFPTSGGNSFTRYNDFDFDIGGPIMHNKLWFYGAYNDTYSGQLIPGFIEEKTGQPATYYVRLEIPTLKLSYQLNDKMKLEVMDQTSLKKAPYRTGSQFVPLEATQNQWSLTSLGPQGKWTYIISPKMTLDASVARAGYWWPTVAHTNDIRKVDLTTTQTRGAYLANYRRPIRWQWNGNFSWFPEIAGKNNELKIGFLGWWDKNYTYNSGYPNQELYQYRSQTGDPAGQYFLHPDSVMVFDYPNYTASIVNFASWFFNDKIKLSRKLTVNAGVRYDHYASKLPPQGNPGIGPYSVQNIYPELTNFPVYTTFTPRFSFAYDVRGDGKLAFKMSYGRYSGAGTAPGASPGPSGSNVNQAATITRTYSKWDGSIPYIPIAANLTSTTGGGGIQKLDTNLKSPYLDEYTASVDWGITKEYLLGFTAVRKFDKGGSLILDQAQPYSAYTDLVCYVDPGPKNLDLGAGPGIAVTDPSCSSANDIRVWSVPRSYSTFGQVNQLTTQFVAGEGTKNFTAFEFHFQKQYSNKWSVLAGYTLDFNHSNNPHPINPNLALYNNILASDTTRAPLPEWNQGIKMNGTYDLPYGIKFASVYNVQSGAWYSRTVNVRNALGATNNSPLFCSSCNGVRVDGHFGRYAFVKLWDNRISKTFHIGDKQTLEAMFDLFNSLNANTIISQVTTNGPTFLQPTASASGATSATAILPPRIFKLGVRYRF
jgi:hypothetical protein